MAAVALGFAVASFFAPLAVLGPVPNSVLPAALAAPSVLEGIREASGRPPPGV